MTIDRYTPLGDIAEKFVDDVISRTPDYASRLQTIQSTVELTLQYVDIIKETIVEATEKALKYTAIDVLRDENAKLMAEVSHLTLDNKRLRGFLGDLMGACIACKKQPYQPHNNGCEWQPPFPTPVEAQ